MQNNTLSHNSGINLSHALCPTQCYILQLIDVSILKVDTSIFITQSEESLCRHLPIWNGSELPTQQL